MQVTFCGAAKTVTGSCFWIKTEKLDFLVDCGMFQGSKEEREKNRREFLFNPGEIRYVLLTHAHIDHSGLIPRLYQQGFKGEVIATHATKDLAGVMLPDSGHIQEMDAEWRSRKKARQGEPPVEPLYTAAEAAQCLQHFISVGYGEIFELGPGVKVRFADAGHILGSAIIEVWVEEKEETTKLVFTGDLGQSNQPIIRNPQLIENADVVFIESTYGTRKHENKEDRLEQLRGIILESINSGGNLIIPSFAVGRTQDILYHINLLQKDGKIPAVPVYIDSPMAVSATEIFRQHNECFDWETVKLLRGGDSPFEFPTLQYVRGVEESRALNTSPGGSIIISASGMCEAGRILHHLKHNLWRAESHVLFVGYQAIGTLGRRLLEGATVVKLFGEEIRVQAKIHNIDGFSAHADQDGLLQWLKGFRKPPRQIYLVHGESETMEGWAPVVRKELGVTPVVPAWGDSYELTGYSSMLLQTMQRAVDQKRVLQQMLKNVEFDYLNLKNRVQQQLSEMDSKAVEKLAKHLHDLQSKINKVG